MANVFFPAIRKPDGELVSLGVGGAHLMVLAQELGAYALMLAHVSGEVWHAEDEYVIARVADKVVVRKYDRFARGWVNVLPNLDPA